MSASVSLGSRGPSVSTNSINRGVGPVGGYVPVFVSAPSVSPPAPRRGLVCPLGLNGSKNIFYYTVYTVIRSYSNLSLLSRLCPLSGAFLRMSGCPLLSAGLRGGGGDESSPEELERGSSRLSGLTGGTESVCLESELIANSNQSDYSVIDRIYYIMCVINM